MSTIFDKTAAHIRRNAIAVMATLLLAVSSVSSTAFAESVLSDSADAASNRFEQPVNLDDGFTESDSASSDLEQSVEDGNSPTSTADTAPDSLGLAEKPPVLSAQDEYQSGTIPVLRLTFHDDVDPETGEVTLSGDEKIDLMNGAYNHSYRAEGVTMDLEVPPAYDNPEDDLWDGVSGYGGEADLSLEFIRGRGNSTWRAAKKPYKFKLDKGANLFGMGKNKHWTLIANYYDTSLTVNRLVAWLGDQMGLSYTPRGVPVDLYLNDAYYGSYLLMEEVRVDSSRVDIDVVDEEAADLDSLDITGGYLIGMARKPLAQSYEYCTTKRTNDYSYDTPEYGAELTEAEQAQQTYLLSYLECMEDAIYSKGLTSPSGDNLWDLMDQASAADYWWIQEFTGNRDAFATPSTYLYKLRDTLNADGTVTTGKLYWGPLWDFDFVWGEFYAESFDNANASWIARLRQDPAFVELLKRRWEVLDGILEQVTTEGGLLDRYLAEMAQSWEGNHQRWPKKETTDWSGGSYAEAIEELRAHIDARRAWINANLDQLPTAYHTVTFMDGDTEVLSGTFRQGEPPTIEPPQMDEREGLLWLGWLLPNGEEYNPYKEYSEDITVCATYVDPSTVIAVQDIFFSFPEIWMSNVSLIRYDLKPANAVDTRIVWTSSDESVVTVDEKGIAWAVEGCLDGAQTASATITATLVGSGKSASFRVVVYDPNSIQLPKPDSIQFESPVTLEVGAYQQVSIASTPHPNDLYEYNYLRFEIEDDEIAEVSDWGVVTAKRPGTTSLIVRRTNPETYEPEVVGTVTVTVTESAPEPTPKPEPTPEPATSADAVPAPSPASQASPSSKQVKATTSTASGKAVLPKTGDTAAPFAGAACLAAAAGVCLLLARRLRR